jgi:predicted MFS family arabinose efflux permease
MSSHPAQTSAGALHGRSAWLMLLALCTAFMLSQSYRTAAAILAPELQARLGFTPQQLGVFAASFHFAFGALQLFMGIGIDLHGVRRTVLTAFPLTIAGALLSAFSTDFGPLVLGQVLIGIGCAPAFLVCTVFIARCFPAHRFAAVSGLAMGIGGVGMLLTGTPLAWLVHDHSLRAGFLMLAALSVLAWFTVFVFVREPAAPPASGPRPSVWQAIVQFGQLLRLPQTLGIMALSAVTYACFITLRGLWLGPLLVERFHYTLIESGHVALAISLVSLLGPPFFGRHDPGPATRRRWIIGYTVLMATFFVLLALTQAAWAAGTLLVLISFLVGFPVLQYADVRSAYPEAQTGRAMAAFTMAMFLGIALMQWFTGLVADVAKRLAFDPYTAVLLTVATLLLAGALAFAALPSRRVS